MRHRIGFNALSRKHSERKALKRNMVTSLFRYERIETTHAKALEVRKLAEKLITRAKEDSVHNRRQVARVVYDEAVIDKLFKQIAPLFKERKGGYTRILKTGNRLGDAAEMVILELVEKTKKEDKKAQKKDSSKSEKKAPAKKESNKKEGEGEEKASEKKAPGKKAPAKKAPAKKAPEKNEEAK